MWTEYYFDNLSADDDKDLRKIFQSLFIDSETLMIFVKGRPESMNVPASSINHLISKLGLIEINIKKVGLYKMDFCYLLLPDFIAFLRSYGNILMLSPSAFQNTIISEFNKFRLLKSNMDVSIYKSMISKGLLINNVLPGIQVGINSENLDLDRILINWEEKNLGFRSWKK